MKKYDFKEQKIFWSRSIKKEKGQIPD